MKPECKNKENKHYISQVGVLSISYTLLIALRRHVYIIYSILNGKGNFVLNHFEN